MQCKERFELDKMNYSRKKAKKSGMAVYWDGSSRRLGLPFSDRCYDAVSVEYIVLQYRLLRVAWKFEMKAAGIMGALFYVLTAEIGQTKN